MRDVRRQDVQALVDRLGADGLSESRIRSVVSALRALYGYAIERGQVEFNPADGLVMPRADEPSSASGRSRPHGRTRRRGRTRRSWRGPDCVAGPDRAARPAATTQRT